RPACGYRPPEHAVALRNHRWSSHETSSRELIRLIGGQSHRILLNGTRAGKRILGNGDQRAADVCIFVPDIGDRAVPLIVVVDVRHIDVGDPGVRDVNAVHVNRADAIRRDEYIARAEGKPADSRSAAERNAETEPRSGANPRYQGRRVYRAHAYTNRSGTPAPAISDVRPTSVVERSKAPGGVIYPGPAPRLNPGPMSGLIGRPAGRDLPRIPDVAITRRGGPTAVLIQILVADYIGRNIARRHEAILVAVAGFRPLIELVRAGRGRDLIGDLPVARYIRLLAGIHAEGLPAAGYFSLARAHGYVGFKRIRIGVEPVVAGTQ